MQNLGLILETDEDCEDDGEDDDSADDEDCEDVESDSDAESELRKVPQPKKTIYSMFALRQPRQVQLQWKMTPSMLR